MEAADWSEAAQRPESDALHNRHQTPGFEAVMVQSGKKKEKLHTAFVWYSVPSRPSLKRVCGFLWRLPSRWGGGCCLQRALLCWKLGWKRRKQALSLLQPCSGSRAWRHTPPSQILCVCVCMCVYLAFVSGPLPSTLLPYCFHFLCPC